MGDELSLLCAAALRGAFWKQVTDNILISLPATISSKPVLFVAALALKALCTSHPFFFFCLDEANPGLVPGLFLVDVLCMTGEMKKNSLCRRDKRVQLCKRFPPARRRWEGVFLSRD